jgi:hypothetical protein
MSESLLILAVWTDSAVDERHKPWSKRIQEGGKSNEKENVPVRGADRLLHYLSPWRVDPLPDQKSLA